MALRRSQRWPSRSRAGDRLIAITTGFEACERVKAVIDPVAGELSPLVLAQAFCESGEDEFSRAIVSAVIDLGDDTSAPPIVTWKGDGSFRSSFGVCVRTDVPLAKVPRPRIPVVEQISEVVFEPNPELPEIRCKLQGQEGPRAHDGRDRVLSQEPLSASHPLSSRSRAASSSTATAMSLGLATVRLTRMRSSRASTLALIP